MKRAVLALALIACGGDDVTQPDAPPDTRDIAVRLAELPGVTVEEKPPQAAPDGYRYFVLHVTQPVDHDDPDGPTFQQEASLIHRDVTHPMVLETTGYDDYFRDAADEPTVALDANQISVEHRYFGESRPMPTDWSKLTITQMAADEHAIVELLKPIYGAAWISTGASKGGMTATYHHRFYPDDVAGTIAYVAPLSFSIPDPRYQTYLADIGAESCAAEVRAVSLEMLQHRRDALLTRAQAQAQSDGLAYTRIAIGPALESAIRDIEWTYWQYYGDEVCGYVPPVTASDDTMFQFLDSISPVAFSDDAETAAYEAYFYQAYAQLGTPGTVAVRGDLTTQDLSAYVTFQEADYRGTLPLDVPVPEHDAAPMADIDDWIQHDGAHFVFVYGEWDPWSGGAYTLGGAADSLEYKVARGTHGATIAQLLPDERDAVLAKLEAWTGVHPVLRATPRRRMRDPRMLHLRGPAR